MFELKQIESFYPESLRPYKRNLLREYLQYKILEIIFSSKFADKLSFMGGTAIHIAHGLPRFSEDLDFDNRSLSKSGFSSMTALVARKLKLEGYNIEAENSFKGAFRGYIKVGDILFENRLSPHKGEKMLIQIDAEPQGFSAVSDKVILNKFDVFVSINVTPPDVLLSQKLYAIFMRKRPMGRDFFDAIFLFGKTRPNLDYLRLKMEIEDFADLKARLLKKCETLDFVSLSKDFDQFLFDSSAAKKVLLFPELVKKLDIVI